MINYSVGKLPASLYELHDRMNDAYIIYKATGQRRPYANQCAAVFFDEVDRFRNSLVQQPMGGDQWDKKRDRRECC